MSVNYINLDITSVIRGVVAHGCNCQGKMGSGVAKAIREKWPVAYLRYFEFVNAVSMPRNQLLGTSQIINVGHEIIDEPNSLFVANMFTQEFYGTDGRVYADLNAIDSALGTTMAFCRGAGLPLYMPTVGCGLGGLSWGDDVDPVVNKLQQLYDVEVNVCML